MEEAEDMEMEEMLEYSLLIIMIAHLMDFLVALALVEELAEEILLAVICQVLVAEVEMV